MGQPFKTITAQLAPEASRIVTSGPKRMNNHARQIAARMQRTSAGCKWLRFWCLTAWFGCILTLLYLLLGVAILMGWMKNPNLAQGLFAVIGCSALISW